MYALQLISNPSSSRKCGKWIQEEKETQKELEIEEVMFQIGTAVVSMKKIIIGQTIAPTESQKTNIKYNIRKRK